MLHVRTVYLNGEFLPAEQARVSPFDRGYLFGDGIYEIIPVFGGRLFRLPHHLERFERSLGEIRLPNPLTREEWTQVAARLIRDAGAADQSVYLQVTRGAAPRDHGFPAAAQPGVLAYATPLNYPAPEVAARGVAAVTADDVRWRRCDIKSISLLANVLARQQAVERGAAEAILIRDGTVTEGAASNVFVVRAGVVHTPPKGPFILPGITRDLVLELARAHDIPAREAPLARAELETADEVWLTSSTREILPVTRLDDRGVGSGTPGPVYQRMRALYQDYKQAFREGSAT